MMKIYHDDEHGQKTARKIVSNLNEVGKSGKKRKADFTIHTPEIKINY